VNGDVELLESTRPVLGLLSQRAGGAERIRLHAGDSLALFTDGITEAADESGEEFGAERLRLMLEGDKELQERHAQILQTVRGHAKGKLADDATLVLVSVRREAANGKASEAEAACCPHEY